VSLPSRATDGSGGGDYSGPIVDAHALLGTEEYLRLEADQLLERMDEAGVDLAVARPMGAGLVVDNRQGNDMLLGASARIKALMTVNPWYGSGCVDEMERCHDLGAVGLFLHPSRQGFQPTESVVQPLVEQAARWGWPVMLHTGTYVESDILAVAILARRFPEVAFVAGFAGFADMWFELPGAMEQTPNLYLETSMIWGEAVEQIAAQGSVSRVLFGSAEPRNRYGVGLRMLQRLSLENDVLSAILNDNARRVFKLP
jgi:uncharacterized protein